jgi:hypothetical protein
MEQQQQELQKAAPVQTIPAVEDFKERHADWLNGLESNHLKMQIYARQIDEELIKKKLPPEQHMDILEKSIKEEFKNYFSPPSKDEHSQAVEGGEGSGTVTQSKKKFTFGSLNDDQKNICIDFERKGVMDRAKYIYLLVKQGDLK